MTKTRLEAFSDGVVAIIITIMVLELETPDAGDWAALQPRVPELLTYVLSFIFIGIYWSNHHHMLHAAQHVNGAVLWANLHLLFWLSLVPFVTAWIGHFHDDAVPAAAYGAVLLMAAVAYTILQHAIIRSHGPGSTLKRAIGRDRKGYFSLAAYATAIAFAFVDPWIADAIYVVTALFWLVPDRRIETTLTEHV
jgi:uncharacterized membrane protein